MRIINCYLLLSIICFGCNSNSQNQENSNNSSSDEQGYPTTVKDEVINTLSNEVTITYKGAYNYGKKVTWSTINLNVTTFENGDIIPEARTSEEWINAAKEQKPAWCYYNNDPSYGEKYGKLYNWYAVNDPRGLAPTGYRIASEVDFNPLFDTYPKAFSAELKSKVDWRETSNNRVVYNKSGFNALPSGYRWGSDGVFRDLGNEAFWWCMSDPEEYRKSTTYDYSNISGVRSHKANLSYDNTHGWVQQNAGKGDGFAVRCIKE
jgi:uncharacterized protein (TIGR02145 family)